MGDERLGTLVRHLRRAIAPAEAVGLRDGQLLERFLRDRDECAFELLLWRHGPMVLGTCRRLLRHAADVDDAFQATFLVLLRKARSVSRGEALGAWLYRVAYRVALRARAAAGRRARRERPGLEAAEVPAPPAAEWDDLRRVLDEEVSRLPARERSAFVLCYLQGKTHAEAGRELGCPEGTVSWRVARARQRLRVRLARRGVALSAAALAGVVSANATAAPVPAALVSAALRAALLGGGARAAAAGAVSASAAALTEGVLQAMLLTKVKGVAAVVLALAAVGAGGGAIGYRAVAGPAQGGPVARLAPRGADADAQQIEALKRENAALKAQLAEMQRRLEHDQVKMKRAMEEARAEAEKALAEAAQRARDAERARKVLTDKADAAKAGRADERPRDNALLRETLDATRAELLSLQQQAKAQQKTLEESVAKHRAVAEQARAEALAMRDQLVRAEKAVADQETRARAEALAMRDELTRAQKVAEEQAVRARAAQKDVANPAAAQKVSDEVELLKAQLDIKRAELAAAQAGAEGVAVQAERFKALRGSGAVNEAAFLKAQTEAKTALAQIRVKEAEVRAAEVALAQAARRQQELGGRAKSPPALSREARLKELDAKLDALRKEIQALRQGQAPKP